MTPTARPTVYNGIQMRSRLEARYAAWLDGVGATWEYEPQCFASGSRQYLPDFLIRDVHVIGRGRSVYVEVKPAMFASRDDVTKLANRMATIWFSEPEAVLVLEVAEARDPLVRLPPSLFPPASSTLSGIWCRTEAGQLSLIPPLERDWTDWKT